MMSSTVTLEIPPARPGYPDTEHDRYRPTSKIFYERACGSREPPRGSLNTKECRASIIVETS